MIAARPHSCPWSGHTPEVFLMSKSHADTRTIVISGQTAVKCSVWVHFPIVPRVRLCYHKRKWAMVAPGDKLLLRAMTWFYCIWWLCWCSCSVLWPDNESWSQWSELQITGLTHPSKTSLYNENRLLISMSVDEIISPCQLPQQDSWPQTSGPLIPLFTMCTLEQAKMMWEWECCP